MVEDLYNEAGLSKEASDASTLRENTPDTSIPVPLALSVPLEFGTESLVTVAQPDVQPPTQPETAVGQFDDHARLVYPTMKDNLVQVEEISDATQEAEYWVSVNEVQKAMQILEFQTQDTNTESPAPWLYLMDLYRVSDEREKYNALKERFIAFFNALAPEFNSDPESAKSRHIEDFPHLIVRIRALWGKSELLPFLKNLLLASRTSKRIGFELSVYRDILLLIAVMQELERMKGAALTTTSENSSAVGKKDQDGIDLDQLNFHEAFKVIE